MNGVIDPKFLKRSLVALIPFLVIVGLILVDFNSLQAFDTAISMEIIGQRTDLWNNIFTHITFWANSTTVVVITTVLIVLTYFIRRDYLLSLWILLTNLIGSLGLNPLMKSVFQRPRPAESLRLVTETSYSFPSGHSFAAVVIYGCLISIIVMYMRPSLLRTSLITLISLFIILIGFSRIYLAAHYLTDVIGGFSLGLFWLMASYSLLAAKLSYKKKIKGYSSS